MSKKISLGVALTIMFIAMAVAALACLLAFFPALQPDFLIQQMINGVSGYVYISIPMFIFAADVMCAGTSANRLIDFAKVFMRHLRGGMGIATAAACTLFGAISGSATATCSAIGGMTIPAMKKEGYTDSFAAAVASTASILGPMIPPSITLIVYASATETSISSLFLATVIPGVLLAVLLVGYCLY